MDYFPQDAPLVQVFLIPDYKDNQSVTVLKSHHIVQDGLATISMLEALSDSYDHKNINGLKPLPLGKSLLITALTPVLHLFASYKLLTMPIDKNSMANGKPLCGKKKGAISSEVKISQVKTLSKKLGCTVNDLMTTILSMALLEYFRKH